MCRSSSRLSAVAFAGAGYALGVIHGDPVSPASMLVGEAGVGLSWLVGPGAALRLDSSYFYAFGANGSLAISLGLVLRPWSAAAQPVIQGREKTGLRIEGVTLDTVYPSLGRFYDNHPVGQALIRNTGRASVFDLKVSYRVPGLMERPRESAARSELKPGETWQAPLSLILGGRETGSDSAASTQSDVAVAFVEGGEQWELRRTSSLDVQASHVVSADDPSAAAAFVSPSDPALRGLTEGISEAIGEPSGAGEGGRSERAAFAVREVVRLLGLRIAPDSAEKNAVRRLKYPGETLHDGGGTSWDVSVLCASLLEASGVGAALVETAGHMLVAVRSGTPSADDTLIVLDGRSWLPVDATRRAGSFRDASAAALRSWKSGSASGDGVLVPVRETWLRYPPPGQLRDSEAPAVPGGLRESLKTAVEAFARGSDPVGAPGAASAETPARPEPRRLLVVFGSKAAPSWPALQRTVLADSLSLALQQADAGVMVIPHGTGVFPTLPEERRKAARDSGADCYIVVEASGETPSPVVTAETEDLLTAAGGRARPGSRVGPVPLGDQSRPDWGAVVSLVVRAYGTGEARLR